MNNNKTETKDEESMLSIESLIQLCQGNSTKAYGGYSIMDSVGDNAEKFDELAKQTVTLKDHYNNPVTGTGESDKIASFANYGYSNDTLNWTLWLALYNDSWVFRRAIDKPAQDEIKCGFTLHGDSDYTNVYKAYNRYKSDLTQLLQWGALFGGSVAVMLFDGISEEEMQKPIDKKKIKGKKFKLYVTDRWYGGYADTEKMVTNMNDIDYGKPFYYDITFANGRSFKIHHSYVLRYEHRVAPQLIRNGQLQGWGYAEGCHILNEMARDDQLKSAITSLVNKSLIEVIKMSGMRGVFMGSDKGNEKQLRKRLEMVNWGRNFNSLTFLDKDDDYTQYTMGALSGLSDIMQQNMWLISASLEMQGVLYGELKGGLSQDSEAYEHYSDTIEDRCNSYFRPVLHKFLKIVFIVEGIDEEVNFDFNPLVKSNKNKLKVDSTVSLNNLLSDLYDKGIITKYAYAKSIQNYLNNNSISINIDEELLDLLKIQSENQLLNDLAEASKVKSEREEHSGGGNHFTPMPSAFGNERPTNMGGEESFEEPTEQNNVQQEEI